MGILIPVRGYISVEKTDAHMRCQISVGDSYPTGCQIMVMPDVQPHTGLWDAVGNVLVLQRWKP